MKVLLGRAFLALALSVALAAPALAAPAMWRISDDDSQVYLFGSVHTFPGRATWRTPAFNKALKAAKLVYFETDIRASSDTYIKALAKVGINPPGKGLTSYLNKKQQQQVIALVIALKLDPRVIEAERPWLAALTLSSALGDYFGATTKPGVEDTLSKEIPAKKKRGFDSVETQLRVMADMSTREQVKFLMDSITLKPGSGKADDVMPSWLKGDVDAIGRGIVASLGQTGSAMYKRFLTTRNKRWEAQIEKLLAGDQDAMVIVGAAHYTGSTGLISLLQKRGYVVERVQ